MAREEKKEHMGGKHHGKGGMGKKEGGFSAHLGKKIGKMDMEGPHEGMKKK